MNTLKYILIGIVALYGVLGIIIYLFQEQFIFLPTVLEKDFQFQFSEPFEEHFLATSNEGEINLLHFKSKSPRGLIVYFHGNAGSLERWGNVVEPFVGFGYDVLIADYRGYGKSTGDRSQTHLLDDAEQVYAFAKKLHDEGQIILYGRSLGSAFASFLAGRHAPKRVILETPFYSLEEEANRRFMMYPVSLFLQYNLRNYQYLEQNNAPVYVFHGTKDRIVSFDSGTHLFESIDSNGGKFIAIEGGFHNNLSDYSAYWEELKSILHE